MTSRITLFIPGRPVSQKRHRHTLSGRVYDPSSTDKANFRRACTVVIPAMPRKGPLRVELSFHFPRPKSHYTAKRVLKSKGKTKAPLLHIQKPDADNLAKFVMDSLNGVYYNDDAQIVQLNVKKEWVDPGMEGTHVRIELMD